MTNGLRKRTYEILSVPRGQRAVLAGRTGSGKTTTARFLLRRSPGAWIILNSKYDQGFKKLPESVTLNTLTNFEAIDEAFAENRFVIIDPPPEVNNPEALDDFISALHNSYENVGLYVDELYQIHRGAQAGPGLVGWLTRGRSKNQSFIGSTQRPAWVSRFVFSESEHYGILALNLADDRKRVYEFIGNEKVLHNPPGKFSFRWYDVADDLLTTFGPVPAAS